MQAHYGTAWVTVTLLLTLNIMHMWYLCSLRPYQLLNTGYTTIVHVCRECIGHSMWTICPVHWSLLDSAYKCLYYQLSTPTK